jgi:hypothetical protein
MTEAEWLACGDRIAVLAFLRDLVSERKLRLYLCAGCRAIWQLLVLKESRTAVEVAEQFADQEATVQQLWHAEYDSEADCFPDLPGRPHFCAAWLANLAAHRILFSLDPERGEYQGFTLGCYFRLSYMTEVPWPGEWLLHDIFGNPFRPVPFDPSWRTSTVAALANEMYVSRDFSAMPILADALQDAGCDREAILIHCRDPQATHVRGCWVVDLVLGKT